ncbi:DNA repair protein Sae2/CtIP [Corchorus capsularis]|uniref:DNA repair protein Sae2/CtIP n=1 Tax=Corchorus capsularis TaxID=210143 RepID=A0A1R3HHF5_COCAP|nr:DNA repair protein Sae2/CtIP [Corchorus capsularis]
MEGHLEQSPRLGLAIDSDDVKYISGLSTILVATIQEAKDRISQIEYIFCSQLYPNFQLKSKGLQKIYTEAKKAAEDAWTNKEAEFTLQIEKLQLEKKQVLEENQSLMLDKEKLLKEQDQKIRQLLLEQEDLKENLLLKCKEVDEGMELQNKLMQLVQENASVVADKGKELKGHEEKTNILLTDLNTLQKKVEALQQELGEKTQQVAHWKKLSKDVLKKIESQALDSMHNEEQLIQCNKEKKLLMANFGKLKENYDELHLVLGQKTKEVEEGRKLQEQLLAQIDFKSSEILKNNQQLAEHGKQKELLLAQVKGLEEKVNSLQVKLRESDAETKISNIPTVAFDTRRMKDVIGLGVDLEDRRGAKPVETSITHTPTSSFLTPKRPSTVKSNAIAGTKRSVSGWRDTRSHQSEAGADPHDDFLDTPLENIRGNLKKAMKEEAEGLPDPEHMNVDSSDDDETQDVSVEKRPQKQETPLQIAEKGSFKYVEPVRKKAEREKLRGFECKQCKKFYDAVLNHGGEDNEDDKKNFRCEHHDGVSRHRYKFNRHSRHIFSLQSPVDLLVELIEHPILVSASHSFKSIQERRISASMDTDLATLSNNPKYVYLFQREYATVDPALVHYVGTDEATTCVGLVIRNRRNGMTSVAHIDSPKFVDIGIIQMLSLVVDQNSPIDLDVHLVGGFEDVSPNHAKARRTSEENPRLDGYSFPLCTKIVETMQKRCENFHIQTLCVLGHNTKKDSEGNAYPIFNGFLVEPSTGSLIPASFDRTARCPDEIVRRLRVSASYDDHSWHGKLLDTYDTKTDRFVIAPCSWNRRLVQMALSLQSLSDSEILATCSTSHSAEGPDFVDNERRMWNYLIEHPDWKKTFPKRQPRVFERTAEGGWKSADFHDKDSGCRS